MKTIVYNGKRYKVFTLYQYSETFEIILVAETYRFDNSLAVTAYSVKDNHVEDSFDSLTVNLPMSGPMKENEAYLNVNSCEWMKDFLKENKLARPARPSRNIRSGFLSYPLWRWNTEAFIVRGPIEHEYKGNLILEFNDGTFLVTRIDEDSEPEEKSTPSLEKAKEWIDSFIH